MVSPTIYNNNIISHSFKQEPQSVHINILQQWKKQQQQQQVYHQF